MKKELKEVKVTVSELAGPDNGKIHSDVSVVGHARNKRPTYPAEYVGLVSGFSDRIPENSNSQTRRKRGRSGYGFELLPMQSPEFTTGQSRSVPPEYSHILFPVQVKVYDFPLPAGSPLPSSTTSTWRQSDGFTKSMMNSSGTKYPRFHRPGGRV